MRPPFSLTAARVLEVTGSIKISHLIPNNKVDLTLMHPLKKIGF